MYEFLPHQYASRVLSINEARDADDLAYRVGGRAVKPNREVLLVGADGATPVLLMADPEMEAAEIADIAAESYERQSKRIAEGRGVIDFAAARQRRGMPSREDAGAHIAQAIADRMEEHRRNPITDPPRQPLKAKDTWVVGNLPEEAMSAG